MYTSLCAIRSWNWNWILTQDNFLIEHWIQRTHRCSAVRCWPWGIYSSWLASRDLGTTRSSYLAWVGPVSQSTPTAAILGETGRFPFHMRRQDRALKLWIRINKLSPTNLLYKIMESRWGYAKCGMGNAKCGMGNAKWEMLNANCQMQIARCEMRFAKCELLNANHESRETTTVSRDRSVLCL